MAPFAQMGVGEHYEELNKSIMQFDMLIRSHVPTELVQ